MISQKDILNIICTEAIEYAGLQEIPGHKHGGKNSFHSAKRPARGPDGKNGGHSEANLPTVHYDLRLVRKAEGTLHWLD